MSGAKIADADTDTKMLRLSEEICGKFGVGLRVGLGHSICKLEGLM